MKKQNPKKIKELILNSNDDKISNFFQDLYKKGLVLHLLSIIKINNISKFITL